MTTEQRIEAVERRQEELQAELARLRARLGEGELTAMQQVSVRELAREIHERGWPSRSRRPVSVQEVARVTLEQGGPSRSKRQKGRQG